MVNSSASCQQLAEIVEALPWIFRASVDRSTPVCATLLKPLIRINIRSGHSLAVDWKDSCFVEANARMDALDEAAKDVADEKGLHRFRRGMQPDFARSLWADSCGYGPRGRGCLCRSFFRARLRSGRDSQAIRSCGS